MRRVFDFRVKGIRKIGRPKKTCLKADVEHSRKVWLNESYANNRWRLGVNAICSMMM